MVSYTQKKRSKTLKAIIQNKIIFTIASSRNSHVVLGGAYRLAPSFRKLHCSYASRVVCLSLALFGVTLAVGGDNLDYLCSTIILYYQDNSGICCNKVAVVWKCVSSLGDAVGSGCLV
uniref:(northern house mosquito) hypothetical protein n=1 Tax=Culex pipiens TaxID=7175 RepID=A0A8D8ILI0_CULPI